VDFARLRSTGERPDGDRRRSPSTRRSSSPTGA